MIDTTYLERCISTLNKANSLLEKTTCESIEYEMYRSACVKEYELIIEQSGKLLKKVLNPYFHSSRAVDKLNFKDIFRHSALHDIVSLDLCERFLKHQDNRNNLAHDYGVQFAEETLVLLPQFIIDATMLAEAIKITNNNQ